MQHSTLRIALLLLVAASVAVATPAAVAGDYNDPAYMGVSPVEADGGVGIGQVFRGTAAEKSGLKAGDVLLSIDGKPTGSASALRRVLRDYESGKNAIMKVRRGDTELELSITFGGRPANNNSIGSDLRSATDPAEGTHVSDWKEADFARLPIPPGAPKLSDEELKPLLARAGMRVRWVGNLENAQMLAHATGRPILWYFRKAPGTPTTEASDYEHYMRSTLFHYESTAGIINRRFVPLYLNMTTAQARELGIGRYTFYEPGFVIVNADLAKLHVVDRIMTFSEDFFVHTLTRILEQVGRASEDSVGLRRAREAAAGGDAAARLELVANLLADGRANDVLLASPPANASKALVAEFKLLQAKAAIQVRQRDAAKKLIEQAAAELPTASTLALGDLALRDGDLRQAIESAITVAGIETATPSQRAQALAIVAEASWRNKQELTAVQYWTRLAKEFPDEPEAWHAATSLIGKSALLFSNETRAALPAAVFTGATPTGTGLPRTPSDNTTVEHNAAALLINWQRSSGQWSDTPYSFLGVEHRRNTITAITATAAWALAIHPGTNEAAAKAALARADAFLLDAGNLSTTAIEKVYAYLYSLLYFARTLELRPEADRPKFRKVVQLLVDKLSEVSNDGQWGHEYTNPFASGMVLIALGEARKAGATVTDEVLKAGADALTRVRGADGAFPYDFSSGLSRAGAEASAGRMPLCEYGLLLAGQSHQKRLADALFAFFKWKHYLEAVRQYDYHSDKFANGGFFFFHDMLGAALAIEGLQDDTSRWLAATKLREMMLSYAEMDGGSFMDSPNIGRTWGTGSSLVTLAILDRVLETTPAPELKPTKPDTPGSGQGDQGEDF